MPRQQYEFLSAHEVEAVFPYGCWTVFAVIHGTYSRLNSFYRLAEAIRVEAPSERFQFSSDEEYFQFVLDREISSANPSISGVAAAVRDVLDNYYYSLITKNTSTTNHDKKRLEKASRLIEVVVNVIDAEGPSQASVQNQHIFNVISSAWRIIQQQQQQQHHMLGHANHVALDEGLVLSQMVVLIDKSLRDRQHLLDTCRKNNEHDHDRVPVSQRFLNLQTVLAVLDRWSAHITIQGGDVCNQRRETIVHIRTAIEVFPSASRLWQLQTSDFDRINDSPSSFDYFQRIEVIDELEPDVLDYSLAFWYSPHQDATGSWLAGGLWNSNDRASTTASSQPSTTSSSPSSLPSKTGFITISETSDDVRECLQSTRSKIESNAVLTVLPMTAHASNDASRAHSSRDEFGTFHRITMIMKPSNNNNYSKVTAIKPFEMMSKCMWFDVMLSRWTPSGCATLDRRRKRHESDVGDAEAAAVMAIVLC